MLHGSISFPKGLNWVQSRIVLQTLFACKSCFPNSHHMTILRKFVTPFFALKRMHADIFLLAYTLFNKQEKHQVSQVVSHDLYWENKMYKRIRSTAGMISQLVIFYQTKTFSYKNRFCKTFFKKY